MIDQALPISKGFRLSSSIVLGLAQWCPRLLVVLKVADLDTREQYTTRERLRYCIEGLHLLGKKSDMALCAAELLSRAANT